MIGWSKSKEKIIQENAFKQKREKPGLKLNPGLTLISLRRTGPWVSASRLSNNWLRFGCCPYYKGVHEARVDGTCSWWFETSVCKQARADKAQLTRFFLYKALDKTRNVCNQSFKRVSQLKQFLQNLWLRRQQNEIHLDSRDSKNMNTLFTKIHFIVKSGVWEFLLKTMW